MSSVDTLSSLNTGLWNFAGDTILVSLPGWYAQQPHNEAIIYARLTEAETGLLNAMELVSLVPSVEEVEHLKHYYALQSDLPSNLECSVRRFEALCLLFGIYIDPTKKRALLQCKLIRGS
jgi:hypothetical protein